MQYSDMLDYLFPDLLSDVMTVRQRSRASQQAAQAMLIRDVITTLHEDLMKNGSNRLMSGMIATYALSKRR